MTKKNMNRKKSKLKSSRQCLPHLSVSLCLRLVGWVAGSLKSESKWKYQRFTSRQNRFSLFLWCFAFGGIAFVCNLQIALSLLGLVKLQSTIIARITANTISRIRAWREPNEIPISLKILAIYPFSRPIYVSV